MLCFLDSFFLLFLLSSSLSNYLSAPASFFPFSHNDYLVLNQNFINYFIQSRTSLLLYHPSSYISILSLPLSLYLFSMLFSQLIFVSCFWFLPSYVTPCSFFIHPLYIPSLDSSLTLPLSPFLPLSQLLHPSLHPSLPPSNPSSIDLFLHLSIKDGAYVNLQSRTGWTPMIYACSMGHTKEVADLIELGTHGTLQYKVAYFYLLQCISIM